MSAGKKIPVLNGASAFWDYWQNNVPSAETGRTLISLVEGVLADVKRDGDQALIAIAHRYGDTVPPAGFRLSKQDAEAICTKLPETTWKTLRYAASHIEQFAQAVMRSVQSVNLSYEGFSVGLDWAAIERVACYIPGGRFPLPSTALMTALSAKAAGVSQIVITSPRLTPEVVAAGTLAGVQEFYQLGGAQAVAALAYGTKEIPPVSMIVGPGNAYVTEAKRQLQGVVGTDLLAGPSEVVIIADKDANPDWMAWDLLAQAEHSPDARACLLTDSDALAALLSTRLEILRQDSGLPDYLRNASDWGVIAVLPNLADCIEISNELAPEHLELLVASPETLKPQLKDYGALFMGYHTPVSLGDYAAGPNHTLPTGKSAKFSGALTPLTFLRPQTWIHASESSTALAQTAAAFATLEGLTAHAHAAQCRVI